MGAGSGVRRVVRFALAGAGLAALAGSASALAFPAPEQLVSNSVARIAEVSKRQGTITRGEFQHALMLTAAGANRAVPRRGEDGYDELAGSALTSLIEAVWLKGQAEEMGIVVTRAQVVRERARIKEENFRTAAEFHKFLRDSRFTRRDLNERVELQVLAVRIQQRVLSRLNSDAEEQKVFREFVEEFNARWRARTVCAPEHAVAHCSNGLETDS